MVVGHNLSSGNFGCTEFHNEYYFVATKRLCCFKLRIIKTVNYCLQSCVLMRQERLSLWVYPTVITFVLFVLQDLLTDPFHPECGHHLCRQCRNLVAALIEVLFKLILSQTLHRAMIGAVYSRLRTYWIMLLCDDSELVVVVAVFTLYWSVGTVKNLVLFQCYLTTMLTAAKRTSNDTTV